MLKIENLKINLSEGKKEIVTSANLTINPGEIHLLNGNNGSGKSTLVNTIMGNPDFEISSGKMILENEEYSNEILEIVDSEFISGNRIELNELEPNVRSVLGIYLANQYPVEIPGVSLSNYLRLIYNVRKPKDEQLSVFKFKKFLEERAEIINYPKHLLKRNLNEGFSGGEKKKTEILQMLLVEPRYVFLDEIDSGLDRTSVKEVFEGLRIFTKSFPKTSLVIITHYDKVREYLEPDFVHEMVAGKLQ